jgi:hypothetical protein
MHLQHAGYIKDVSKLVVCAGILVLLASVAVYRAATFLLKVPQSSATRLQLLYHWIAAVGLMIFYPWVMISSSFVEEEQYVWTFAASTIVAATAIVSW